MYIHKWIKAKTNYTWKKSFVLQDQGVEVIGKGLYKSKNKFRETFHRKPLEIRNDVRIL